MKLSLRLLTAGALLTTAVVAAVLISVGVQLDFAVSDDRDDSEIAVRVQARQTDGGRVEVRAQSSVGGHEWMTHTPDLRFLPAEPEPGRWYSSSSLTVNVPAAASEAPVEPAMSDEAAYTQFLVAGAIDYYELHGREAAVRHHNSAASADGQWYVFIIDEDDVMVAHQNSDLRDVPGADVLGPDGYPVGRMVIAVASEDGAWVDYQFTNPATGRAEIKHSWIVRHAGLIFGSGWYEDAPSKIYAPGAYTQSYVERALEMYRVLGREATLEYYNSPDTADDQWYMFIHEADGTRVAHAYRSEQEGWLGSNVGDSGVDVTGYDYGAEMLAIEDSGWVSYVFVNPDDEGKYQRKNTWIVRHDGLIFGSGWYEPDAYEAP